MSAVNFEERLALLEDEFGKLHSTTAGERPRRIGQTSPDFLDKCVGIHANSPLFEPFVDAIVAERARQRQEALELAKNEGADPNES